MLFRGEEERCLYCHLPRYKDVNNSTPAAIMRYLPLGQLLGSMLMSSEYRDMFRETYNRRTEENLTDIFDASIFDEYVHLFQNEFDTAVALYIDGFNPFRRNSKGSLSMTIVHLVILNLPKTER